MILRDIVKNIVDSNTAQDPLYLRNLIKEEIQNYILNFVFNSSRYNQLIFTGGTCLRKVYGLNRLSEDLDFDYLEEFAIDEFSKELESYFKSVIKYNDVTYSIAGNNNSVYFKFPLLKEINPYTDRVPEDIFVRCDFFNEKKGGYVLDKNAITAGSFQFFVASYDLSTLFTNKLVAFLKRSFYKGKFQKTPFKGRDIYDLYWLMQLSAKSSYKLKINTERLTALLGEEDPEKVKKEFREKMEVVDDKFLYEDLLPLIESKDVLEGFISSYKEYLVKYIDMVL